MIKPSPEAPIGNGRPHRWRRYPKYKPSGVEWLGEVPEGWGLSKIKFKSNVNMGQSPNSEDCNIDGEGIPFLQGTAEFGAVNPSPKQYCKIAKKTAKKNHILISVRAPVGDINIADQEYGIGRGLSSINCNNSDFNDRYCWYLLHHARIFLTINSYGSTYDAVAVDDVKNVNILLPKVSVQTAVAAFLDRETARIDVLIAKKERQIELLQEKRAALISHVVTKGLDPSVPMKDSGVEWLGMVPEGWEVIPLKYGWIVTDCKHITAEYVDDGIPIVSTTEVKPGRLSLINTRKTTKADYLNSIDGRCPKRGDIIYSRNASLGSAAYVDTDEKFCMGQDVCRIASDSNNGLFLTYQLNCPIILNQIESQMIGSTIKRINVEQIKNLTVIKPPVQEQKKIALFIDTAIIELDSLANTIENSITLLNEYRSTLISAAVTGKIDVRQEAKV